MQADTKLPGEAEHLMVPPLCSYTFVTASSLLAGVSSILKGSVTAGVACLYAHSDAELRSMRATGVRWSALAWPCWLCGLHKLFWRLVDVMRSPPSNDTSVLSCMQPLAMHGSKMHCQHGLRS